MNNIRVLLLIAFGFMLILVSISDIRLKKIPDKYILVLGIIGIVSIPFFLEINLAERIVGIFSVSIPLLFITVCLPGSFGGGDIKLMAVSGLFLGCQYNWAAFVAAMLFAGVYAIGVFLENFRKGEKRSSFALGPFLCLGIMTAALWGEQMIHWFMN